MRAPIVRMAARQSDVIVTPSTAMAERVAHILPSVRNRIVPHLNPCTPVQIPGTPRDPVILCPVIFSPYKHMIDRLRDWIAAADEYIDPSITMLVTATPAEVPPDLANNRRIQLVGQLSHAELRPLWARSMAIFFPPGLESFGFPLAEARVNGQPVIAQDTEQNREIAGPALCGFTVGDTDSLRHATELALKGITSRHRTVRARRLLQLASWLSSVRLDILDFNPVQHFASGPPVFSVSVVLSNFFSLFFSPPPPPFT